MKDNKSGWQFPKALEIIKCKEGNKEFMKERPARRPFGNTVLICEYPIDDTAAEEPNAKLITEVHGQYHRCARYHRTHRCHRKEGCNRHRFRVSY